MKNLLKFGVAAAFLGTGVCNVAMADTPTTSGGLKIKTDDGKFEFGIGGRIQFDTVIFDDDKLASVPGGFRSTSGAYLRRGYLTLTGKLYDWTYKFENDFGAGASPNSFRDLYISHKLFGGDLTIGQAKPYRVYEEQVSDLENLALERVFTTNVLFASGGARQYQPGVFYKLPVIDGLLVESSFYNANHALGNNASQGVGTSNRITYLAINQDNLKVHVGVWGGIDSFSKTSPGAQSVNYAGRNNGTQVVGPSQQIETLGAGAAESFYGFEFAGQYDSFYLQGEYAKTKWEDARGAGRNDRVDSYNVGGSYFVTGEKKVYKAGNGVFGNPKIVHPYGAVELIARYDDVKNFDRKASAGAGVCQAAANVVVAGADCNVSQYTIGANYYFNSAVRVQFNYVSGTNDVTDDNTSSYNVRLQLAF